MSRLRNLAGHPPSPYDDDLDPYTRGERLRSKVHRRYQEETYRSGCTPLYFGIDMKFVYYTALFAIAVSEDRPLWWIAQNQVDVEGWDHPPDCELRLRIRPFNLTAWNEHVRNYTQPQPV